MDKSSRNESNYSNEKISFNGKILIIGCGAIAKALTSVLFSLVDVPYKNITMLDRVDLRHNFTDLEAKGVSFIIEEVMEQNYTRILETYLSKGDLFVDVAFNLGTCEILDWCLDHDVMYFNTALYKWSTVNDEGDFASLVEDEGCLYYETLEEMEAAASVNRKSNNKGPTAVLAHGANPGLVNHLMKRGIEDIAHKILSETSATDASEKEKLTLIRNALDAKDYGRLAQLEGVKIVQISEVDTQKTNVPKEKGVFVSSWNIPSFCEEAAASAEFPSGTHEKSLSASKYLGKHEGENSYIVLPTRAHVTWAKTWIPGFGEILGTIPHHEETVTMAEYVSIREPTENSNGEKEGKLVYQPTVYFCYRPMDMALESLQEFADNKYVLQEKQYVINDDIVEGGDYLGVLLLGHQYKGWWIGSLLDIDTTRSLAPHNSATSLQVGASAAAAIRWMILHPHEGAHFPETLPTDEILHYTIPYLGKYVSQPVDWLPVQLKDGESATDDQVWQLENFLVKEPVQL